MLNLRLNFSRLNAALALGGVLLLSACGGGNEGANGDLTGNIQIDGSSTVYPITEAVAEEFRNEAEEVRVTVGVSGTGGGMKKFSRGEIDIVNASRSMNANEDELAKSNNISYIELPVAYDGLTVVVHPENDWVKDITVAELKKIWEPAAQGTIKKWNQIRPEWPDQEIHLYGAGVESGTYDYFTEAIVGESHASRGDYTASEDDNVLVQGVSTDPYALGFFGYAYYDENKEKLKAVPVDDQNDSNGAGAIMPSLETVKDGSYAPLSRPLFIYVSSKATARPEVVQFVNFYLDNAAQLSEEVGYIPMPAEKYEEQKQKFQQFVGDTGSSDAKQ
ncbi:PstS family phosphate ABC transporter substrate-binding protein [Pontibacter akesuensis]|uniref:Phosphate-binding protein n=1 Tax=Pontibacter akesuensis TaxID=388950 RepID=A0A1I7JM55_9BACT|nr:PstS family phosphate ABC transporter substrate-binding protein [Pontibacter akesuensis]GHA68974.1 phosphate ABC transporter substrate-binding protein [Pontibacter akesuensis]SFU86282.1 phosphate ABC transporter substrate-binding protein, PhoT family [Pontibacter akesuensis]